MYVEGLEVWHNTYWEWEDAIFAGCEMFHQLCQEMQGTVHVDLANRRLTFEPTVSPNVQGITVGLGMGAAALAPSDCEVKKMLSTQERAAATAPPRLAYVLAAKRALLGALGLEVASEAYWSQIEVRLDAMNTLYVKAREKALDRAWALRAIDYKAAFIESAGSVLCTATAIADVADVDDISK